MSEDKEKRFVRLSWLLLGHKFMYYYPDKVHPSWKSKLAIPDSEYDELEKEYLRLCLELGYENTVAGQTRVDGVDVSGPGMTELDSTRPSVELVKSKYTKRRIR